MDKSTLNRLGILLNFLAGFLLAPEIIGIERIRKWEEKIEPLLKRIEPKLHDQLYKIFEKGYPDMKSITMFVISSAGLLCATGCIYFLYLSALDYKNSRGDLIPRIVYVTFFLMLLAFLVGGLGRNGLKKYYAVVIWYLINIFLAIYSFGYAVLFFMGSLLLVAFILYGLALIYIILFPVVKSIHVLIKYSIYRLEGNEKLRGYLISIGILLFVVGNLLQYIGS